MFGSRSNIIIIQMALHAAASSVFYDKTIIYIYLSSCSVLGFQRSFKLDPILDLGDNGRCQVCLVLLSSVYRKEDETFIAVRVSESVVRAPNFDAVVPTQKKSALGNCRHWDPYIEISPRSPSRYYFTGICRINIHWHKIMADHRSPLYTVSSLTSVSILVSAQAQ